MNVFVPRTSLCAGLLAVLLTGAMTTARADPPSFQWRSIDDAETERPARPRSTTDRRPTRARGVNPTRVHGDDQERRFEAPAPEAVAESEAETASREATAAKIVEVEAKLAELMAATDLDPELAGELKSRYEQALKWLRGAETARRMMAEWKSEAAALPKTIETAKATLAEPMSETAIEIPPRATLAEFEGLQAAAEAERAAAEQALEKLDADVKSRGDRKAEIPKLVEQSKADLETLRKSLEQPPAETIVPQLVEARRTEMQARVLGLEARLPLLKAELVRIEATSELVPLQRDLAARAVAVATKRAEAWQQRVAEERRAESARQAEEARREVARAHPALKSLAERNAELAEERTALVAEIERITAERDRVRERLEQVAGDHDAVLEKVEVAGLTTTIGLLLRKTRYRLPRTTKQNERIRFVEEEVPRIQLLMLALEEERGEIADANSLVDGILSSDAAAGGALDPSYLEAMAVETIDKKRTYLGDLHGDYDTYLERLGELELASRKLIERTDEFRDYIDEHVLWIRSADVYGVGDAKSTLMGLFVLLDPAAWTELWTTTATGSRGFVLLLVLVLGAAALTIGTPLAIRRVSEAGKRSRGSDESSSTLLEQALWTLLASSVWPLLLYGCGWCLRGANDDFARSSAGALVAIVPFVWVASLTRLAFRHDGLAETQFGWRRRGLRSLSASIGWLVVLGVPAAFVVEFAHGYGSGQWNDTLGRSAFTIGMLWTSLVLLLAIGPHRRILDETTGEASQGWTRRVRSIGIVLLTTAPLVLVAFAVCGYYYTAEQLAVRYERTIWLLLGVVVVQAPLVQWAKLVTRRVSDLRMRLMRERSADREASDHEIPVEREEFDPASLDGQLRRLLRSAAGLAFVVGCYAIWIAVLPALGILDRVELWSTTERVAEAVEAADGTVETQMVDQRVPTTLGHALLAVLVLFGTYAGSRSLPYLLEILVVQRLRLDGGARNALVTIAGYVLLVAGTVTASAILGIRWSSVQWLVAAMSVGLGFGLQEIIANFVSGLIILFEQPMRVGDIVTVGGTTGRVSRIRIRATTIVDWDRRELIVPNKRFITDELVNWTLSDPVTRVVVPVGIAYGSDTAKAHALLLDVARRNPLVLDEPPASAFFTGFGASTLDFELRFFIPRRDEFPQILHEINTAIDDAFREADIEIAFPQQDIHVRSFEAVLPTANGAAPVPDGEAKRAA